MPWGPHAAHHRRDRDLRHEQKQGPFLLTLDIVFPDQRTYERFKALKALDRVTIAGLYGVMAEDVLKIIEFDPAYAVKITMRRPIATKEPSARATSTARSSTCR